MASTCSLCAISRATLYRLLREGRRPRDAHRADRGRPRLMPPAEIERWCEIVAALEARTTTKKGRCLSTARVLELLDAERSGAPTLMLFSVVDDRSGLAYLEYHCVYGEDVEAALRFLFAAMSPKSDSANPLQGIPARLHLDNGPVAKSGVLERAMESLGIEVTPHLPAGADGRRRAPRVRSSAPSAP